MTVVVLIQARTSSTRLPAKVMLPVCGYPLSVLAAKRAANTGLSVVVVTSSESSDDGLVNLLIHNSIKYFRGDLNNTLERFVSALDGFSDDTLVFRLTADNVFPDGFLLDEVQKDFTERGLDYLNCNGIDSGLPYGMSIELTYAKHLREANDLTQGDFDREHVTPYIIRKFGATFFTKYLHYDMGRYRCTVDCLDDYLTINKLFESVTDCINTSSLQLVEILKQSANQPVVSEISDKLVLGGAQFGLLYGISNKHGKPTLEESSSIIKAAITNGVSYIDTARAYGTSENVIGQTLGLGSGWQGRAKIITKLAPLDGCPETASATEINAFVDSSVFTSLWALRTDKIDVLLLHRVNHLFDFEGMIWSRLLYLKNKGFIDVLGVSVQNPDELKLALKNEDINHIQLPINILDWRWEDIEQDIIKAKSKRIIKIHARSTILQGLLIDTDNIHWKLANVEHPELIREWLTSQCVMLGRESILDLCIAYVASIPWVDGVVIGMEIESQLIENLKFFEKLELSLDEYNGIVSTRPKLNHTTLNPSCWKTSI